MKIVSNTIKAVWTHQSLNYPTHKALADQFGLLIAGNGATASYHMTKTSGVITWHTTSLYAASELRNLIKTVNY